MRLVIGAKSTSLSLSFSRRAALYAWMAGAVTAFASELQPPSGLRLALFSVAAARWYGYGRGADFCMIWRAVGNAG